MLIVYARGSLFVAPLFVILADVDKDLYMAKIIGSNSKQGYVHKAFVMKV